ncbi:MAG TPA: SatD family protein [Flavobacterium sp.]
MDAVITADIINSRKVSPDIWFSLLKDTLQNIGAEYSTWEVYRGDSIQLITSPINALYLGILLKAVTKQIPNLDIRMAIGIGEITYRTEKVSSSNGPAFINSGEAFDALNKNTLAIKSPWKDFDEVLNIMLDLATLTMNNWKPAMAEIFKKQLENPDFKQVEIAESLNKKQSNVSYSLKKAGYDEIMNCVAYYKREMEKLCYS